MASKVIGTLFGGILVIIGIALMWAVASFITGVVVMWAWNGSIAQIIDGVGAITYWQGFLISWLSGTLLSGGLIPAILNGS